MAKYPCFVHLEIVHPMSGYQVFSVMFSTRTALDYREQCFGGQAQSLIEARC